MRMPGGGRGQVSDALQVQAVIGAAIGHKQARPRPHGRGHRGLRRLGGLGEPRVGGVRRRQAVEVDVVESAASTVSGWSSGAGVVTGHSPLTGYGRAIIARHR